MTITERRMLKELIDNDFSVLRQEIDIYAEELKRIARERVEREYNTTQERCDRADHGWRELQRNVNQMIDDFLDGQREAGIFVNMRYSRVLEWHKPEFSVIERDQALNNIQNEVNREVNKAKTELERKRVALHRDVLLSGLVSEEAKNLLDAQPDARAILSEALHSNPNFQVINQAVQQIEGVVDVPADGVRIPEVLDS